MPFLARTITILRMNFSASIFFNLPQPLQESKLEVVEKGSLGIVRQGERSRTLSCAPSSHFDFAQCDADSVFQQPASVVSLKYLRQTERLEMGFAELLQRHFRNEKLVQHCDQGDLDLAGNPTLHQS